MSPEREVQSVSRSYSTFSPNFWTGETGRELATHPKSHELKLQAVAAYLFTCNSANMIGLYYIPALFISHEVGLEQKAVGDALAVLQEIGFSHYDPKTSTVWVREMAHHQVSAFGRMSPKQRIGVQNELEKWRKTPFFGPFLDRYKIQFGLANPYPPEYVAQPVVSPVQSELSLPSEDAVEDACETISQGIPDALESVSISTLTETNKANTSSRNAARRASSKGAAKKEKEPPRNGAIGTYFGIYETRYGHQPHPTKEDIIAANKALMTFDEDKRHEIVTAYLMDDDAWLVKNAHALRHLPRNLDRILAKLNGKLPVADTIPMPQRKVVSDKPTVEEFARLQQRRA